MQIEMRIYKTPGGYVVRSNDPEVLELFGTDTLPTAYTPEADQSEVLSAIRNLNRECRVTYNGVLDQ